ncbi:MAG: hypothetical protein MJY55_03925 [Bacteroidales bacterium]|nr:hypothetical protein [Bacteroidales bacterium]
MKLLLVFLSLVTFGNARFTILTDRMVRMEWADSAKFEDGKGRVRQGCVGQSAPDKGR